MPEPSVAAAAGRPVRLAASLDGPRRGPVLVLANSLGTTREIWDPQLLALGDGFRLLRYEHRGHGGSPPPPRPRAIPHPAPDTLRPPAPFGVATPSHSGRSLRPMIRLVLV